MVQQIGKVLNPMNCTSTFMFDVSTVLVVYCGRATISPEELEIVISMESISLFKICEMKKYINDVKDILYQGNNYTVEEMRIDDY